MWKNYLPMAFAGCLGWQQAAALPQANDNSEGNATDQAGQFAYVGNVTRITVAYDSEYDLSGELFLVLDEKEDAAWLANAWIARDAGGIQLSRHWLANGDLTDPDGDFTVYKLFVAADQNEHQDRKITAGWGMEKPDYFIDAYLSAAVTGARDWLRNSSSDTDVIQTEIDGQLYHQAITTTTYSTIFSHPYDYGVGLRVGRFFDEQQVRTRLGLDYEWGEEGASQITLSMSGEKFFRNTPHSVGLRADYYHKNGDLQRDEDLRFNVFYRYSLGQAYRPERVAETVYDTEQQVVRNEIDLDADALFDFDKAELRPDALQALDELVARLREAVVMGAFGIVGHTCDIGTTEYNQGLSERRAAAVRDYLIGKGFAAEELNSEGRGELEPRYPNDDEANRRKNRRVDITVLTARPVVETVRVPTVHWKSQPVKIKRALYNPVEHKRRVDYYRIEKQEVRTERGEPVAANRPPSVVNDAASTPQDSAGVFIDVLANDSDPDGDGLSVTGAGTPANGSVVNNGNGVTYIPAPGFSGTDSFSYSAGDGKGGSGSATVTVTVTPGAPAANRAPTARDDQATTNRDTPVDIAVLNNDSDPDGDPLSIASVTQPAQGSVVNHGSYLSFTPAPGVRGSQTFGYTTSDGRGGTDSAIVVVRVPIY